MRVTVATVVFLTGLIPAVTSAQYCSCQGNRGSVSWLADLVTAHRDVFLELYEPCGGKADPSYFMVPPANRHLECPQFAECLDSAQAKLFDLLKQVIKKPEVGSHTIYLIKGGYVISAYSINSDGEVVAEQGEPDYGVSRELRDYWRTSPTTSRCGPGFLSCPLGRRGYLVAVPVVNAKGQHLGEVQLNVFLPLVRKKPVLRNNSCAPQKMNPGSSERPAAGGDEVLGVRREWDDGCGAQKMNPPDSGGSTRAGTDDLGGSER